MVQTYSEQFNNMQSALSNASSPWISSMANRMSPSAEAIAETREDTAIQRAVADMKSAGINPVLGFTGAGAASSAAGASSVSAQAQLKAQKIAGIFSIVSSALSLAGGLFGKK